MVSKKFNITTRAMKRSSSGLQEPRGLNVAPQLEMSVSHPSFTPLYRYYAMIFIDNEGHLQVEESQSVRDRGSSLFTPEVRQNFLEILGDPMYCRRSTQPTYRPLKCLKSNHPLRSASSWHLTDHDSDSEVFNDSASIVSLKIGDTAKIMAYYERAYSDFQQLNCRMIAKEFVRAIEPMKQVRRPYIGKAPEGFPSGIKKNPEATKPEWWPPGVMHKEPDHMRKEYRLKMLIHITCKLRSYGITSDKLKQVARDTERKLPDPKRAEVIYEILRVRKMQEQFERGEVDKNVIVNIVNGYPFEDNEDKSINAVSPFIEKPKHPAQEPMVSKPVKQDCSPLNTPIDDLSSASIRDLPVSLSGYTLWPQYTNLSSQPGLSTNAEMIRTQCSVGNTFAASANLYLYTEPPYPHGPRIETKIHQDITSPAIYGAPATIQGLSSPQVNCQDSTASGSLHDIAHHHYQTPMNSVINGTGTFIENIMDHLDGLPPKDR